MIANKELGDVFYKHEKKIKEFVTGHVYSISDIPTSADLGYKIGFKNHVADIGLCLKWHDYLAGNRDSVFKIRKVNLQH